MTEDGHTDGTEQPEGSPGVGPSGFLVIDKPLGKTSRAMCTLVRTRLRRGGAPKRIKVGHGGTLDPLATGVVVILVGRATRLCDRVMVGEKRYVADVDLAHVSVTDDLEATPEAVEVGSVPGLGDVERACQRFVGRVEQVPPAHSAIKVGGRRAYEIARRGEDPGLKARVIEIHAIEILEYAFPRLRIDVRCGKGTYIRSLARDLGKSLGVGGMLVGLRRTRVGEFFVEKSVKPEDLGEAMGQEDLIPLDD